MGRPGKKSFTVGLDEADYEKLVAYSDHLLVSLNWLVHRAVREFVDKLPDDPAEVEIFKRKEV